MKTIVVKTAVVKTALMSVALSLASAAAAGPVCTSVPQAKWMSPAKMKARVAKLGYTRIKAFKVSGSCYEIYGYARDGRRAEVYFNPVTGAIVKSNLS